jgi:4-hydroxy-tetrahydrodipicolinate reductase
MVHIGICGVSGRMGKAILQILQEKGHRCSVALDGPDSPMIGKVTALIAGPEETAVPVTTIEEASLGNTDVLIDFSAPPATMKLLSLADRKKVPLVIGTTGFSDAEKEKIEEASRDFPILMSPNMSPGVNLLFKLTEIAARSLDRSYDVEVYEAHHRFKKDAPSGTANRLIEIVRAMEGMEEAPAVHGREGMVGQRSDREIGVQCMRGGDIVGDHTVSFVTLGERIELTHRAISRDILARGAVTAAEFMQDKKKGFYTMFDVLGL